MSNDFSKTVDGLDGVIGVQDVGRDHHQRRGVRIIVDSTADYAPEVAERLGVEVIPFTYITPEGEQVDDLWRTSDPHAFYERMRQNPGMRLTTCAVTPGRYFEVFERAAKAGLPTIYMGLPAGLSSSIDSARQAADMIQERYPGFELYVLDNCCDSAAGELLAIEAVHQASMGLSAEELYAWAKDARYFEIGRAHV